MKKFIIFIAIIIISKIQLTAGDIEYPQLIDGGVINCRLKQALDNSLKQRVINFDLINKTNEIIYFYQAKIINHYNNSIYKNGNINKGNFTYFNFPLTDQGVHLFPGDTFHCNILFNACFVDSISNLGGNLQSTGRLYYRKSSSINLDSIDINTQFKVIDSTGVFFNTSKNNYGRFTRDFFNNTMIYYDGTGTIYNLTNKIIIIDSISNKFFGPNFSDQMPSIYENIDSVLNIIFPYELDSNSFLKVSIPTIYKQPALSQCIMSVNGHYKSNSTNIVMIDTIMNLVSLNNKLEYQSWLPPVLTSNINDTIDFKLNIDQFFYIDNYSDKKWSLIDIKKDFRGQGICSFKINYTLPIKIDTLKNIKNPFYFQVINTLSGYDTLEIILDFKADDGEIFEHNIVYYFYFPNKTEVGDNPNPEITSIQVYPNPSAQKLFISFSESIDYQVQIIDLFGNIYFTNKTFEENKEINVSEYPTGVYAVIIQSTNKIYRKLITVVH